MKFETELEIDAPRDYCFEHMTDLERLEASARSMGADIRRLGGANAPGEGVQWRGSADVRGKTRGIDATMSSYNRPELARVDARIGGMESEIEMAFEEAGAEQCRARVAITLKPKTLAARLIVQSARLAKRRIQQRLDARVVSIGNRIEVDYRRSRDG